MTKQTTKGDTEKEARKTIALITDFSQYEYVAASAFFWVCLSFGDVSAERIILSCKRRGLVGKIKEAARRGADTIVIVGDDLIGDLTEAELNRTNAALAELPAEVAVLAYGEACCPVVDEQRHYEDSHCLEYVKMKKSFRLRVRVRYPERCSFACSRFYVARSICEGFSARAEHNAFHLGLEVPYQDDFNRCPKSVLALRKVIENFVHGLKPRAAVPHAEYFHIVDEICLLTGKVKLLTINAPSDWRPFLNARCQHVLRGGK